MVVCSESSVLTDIVRAKSLIVNQLSQQCGDRCDEIYVESATLNTPYSPNHLITQSVTLYISYSVITVTKKADEVTKHIHYVAKLQTISDTSKSIHIIWLLYSVIRVHRLHLCQHNTLRQVREMHILA